MGWEDQYRKRRIIHYFSGQWYEKKKNEQHKMWKTFAVVSDPSESRFG